MITDMLPMLRRARGRLDAYLSAIERGDVRGVPALQVDEMNIELEEIDEMISQLEKMGRYTHQKTRQPYTLVGFATVQTRTPLADNDRVAIYESELHRSLWARPIREFTDGRFVEISREVSGDWRTTSTKTEDGYNG